MDREEYQKAFDNFQRQRDLYEQMISEGKMVKGIVQDTYDSLFEFNNMGLELWKMRIKELRSTEKKCRLLSILKNLDAIEVGIRLNEKGLNLLLRDGALENR